MVQDSRLGVDSEVLDGEVETPSWLVRFDVGGKGGRGLPFTLWNGLQNHLHGFGAEFDRSGFHGCNPLLAFGGGEDGRPVCRTLGYLLESVVRVAKRGNMHEVMDVGDDTLALVIGE